MSGDILDDRRKGLEDAFFRKQEKDALEHFKNQRKAEERLTALQKLSGIQDRSLILRLLDVGVTAEALAALVLTPLVRVAWADGKIYEGERNATFNAAAQKGILPGTDAYNLLQAWLTHPPDKTLDEAWKFYMIELQKNLSVKEMNRLKDHVLTNALNVGESAGGFLGLGSGLSKKEMDVFISIKKELEN